MGNKHSKKKSKPPAPQPQNHLQPIKDKKRPNAKQWPVKSIVQKPRANLEKHHQVDYTSIVATGFIKEAKTEIPDAVSMIIVRYLQEMINANMNFLLCLAFTPENGSTVYLSRMEHLNPTLTHNYKLCIKNIRGDRKDRFKSTLENHPSQPKLTDAVCVIQNLFDNLPQDTPYNDVARFCGAQSLFECVKPSSSPDYDDSRACRLIMWNANYTIDVTDENSLNALQLDLPRIPNAEHLSLSYSTKYGLIAMGASQLRYLAFTNKTNWAELDHLRWQTLDQYNLNTIREQSSSVIIKEDDGQEIIFVIGSSWNKSMEYRTLKPFSSWKPLPTLRCGFKHGICYDQASKNIYVGGGVNYPHQPNNGHNQIVDCFDVRKSKWRNLPSTTKRYAERPALWVDPYNPNLLFIAGKEGVEYADMRQSTSESGQYWTPLPMTGKFPIDLFITPTARMLK